MSLTPNPQRLIKLGGSLLDLPDLPERFTALHQTLEPAVDWIVVGGGRWVDVVRHYQTQTGLPDRLCHDLSLRAMHLSAMMVTDRCGWDVQASWPTNLTAQSPGDKPIVLDVGRLALQDTTLPASWDLTSDSLAAWAAKQLEASSLILLKSCQPEGDWRGPQGRGVDRCFHAYSQGIPHVDWVNLRSDAWG